MKRLLHDGTNPGFPGTPAEYVKALGGGSTRVITMQPCDTAEF